MGSDILSYKMYLYFVLIILLLGYFFGFLGVEEYSLRLIFFYNRGKFYLSILFDIL